MLAEKKVRVGRDSRRSTHAVLSPTQCTLYELWTPFARRRRVIIKMLALLATSAAWDGSFAPLVAAPGSFCTDYGFGSGKPYVCSGGGLTGPPALCRTSCVNFTGYPAKR